MRKNFRDFELNIKVNFLDIKVDIELNIKDDIKVNHKISPAALITHRYW